MNALARNLNVSAFIFSYRGYGRSEGTPSEKVLPSVGVLGWLTVMTGCVCLCGARRCCNLQVHPRVIGQLNMFCTAALSLPTCRACSWMQWQR